MAHRKASQIYDWLGGNITINIITIILSCNNPGPYIAFASKCKSALESVASCIPAHHYPP